MSYEEFLVRARQAEKKPDLSRILSDLSLENGPLAQLAGTYLEARDALTEASVLLDLNTPAEINKAVNLRGQVQGINTCLALIHSLMTEESQDALVPASIV